MRDEMPLSLGPTAAPPTSVVAAAFDQDIVRTDESQPVTPAIRPTQTLATIRAGHLEDQVLSDALGKAARVTGMPTQDRSKVAWTSITNGNCWGARVAKHLQMHESRPINRRLQVAVCCLGMLYACGGQPEPPHQGAHNIPVVKTKQPVAIHAGANSTDGCVITAMTVTYQYLRLRTNMRGKVHNTTPDAPLPSNTKHHETIFRGSTEIIAELTADFGSGIRTGEQFHILVTLVASFGSAGSGGGQPGGPACTPETITIHDAPGRETRVSFNP
jgi:hypothetical protein